MKLSEAKKKGFFRIRINIGQYFECDKDENVYVVLREPTYAESQLVGEDDEAANEKFLELLPSLLIDHNFEKDAGGAATAKEVVDILECSVSALVYVVQTWKEALPLTKMTAGNSDKSQGSGSKTIFSPPK
jgi:hypothetical protein